MLVSSTLPRHVSLNCVVPCLTFQHYGTCCINWAALHSPNKWVSHWIIRELDSFCCWQSFRLRLFNKLHMTVTRSSLCPKDNSYKRVKNKCIDIIILTRNLIYIFLHIHTMPRLNSLKTLNKNMDDVFAIAITKNTIQSARHSSTTKAITHWKTPTTHAPTKLLNFRRHF